jgi:hypothetical protein
MIFPRYLRNGLFMDADILAVPGGVSAEWADPVWGIIIFICSR